MVVVGLVENSLLSNSFFLRVFLILLQFMLNISEILEFLMVEIGPEFVFQLESCNVGVVGGIITGYLCLNMEFLSLLYYCLLLL